MFNRLFSLSLMVALAVTSLSSHAESKIGLLDIRTALFASDTAKAFSEKTVGQFKQQELEVRAVGEDGTSAGSGGGCAL